MSEQKDHVKIVPYESLQKLRDRYEGKVLIVNFIESMIYKSKEYYENNKIYSINGAIDDDATFVGVMSSIKGIMIGSLKGCSTKFHKILNSIDFSDIHHFMSYPKNLEKFILDFISERQLGKIKFIDDLFVMRLKQEEALKLEINIPEGFELKKLSIEDSTKIHSIWSIKSLFVMDTKKYIEHCIQTNINVGLFDKNNELLAWIMTFDFLSLMHLYTISDHRRKGYASLMVKAISKKMANELNCDITAFVALENSKSLKLFKKLRFEQDEGCSWLGFGEENGV